MFAPRALACVGLALVFAGCGGGDDDSGAPQPTSGTCDLRARQETCIEVSGTAPSIANEKNGCAMYGTWSSDPCPMTADLIGCCTYTFGSKFHECFYSGTPQKDPEAYCTDTALWSDGVWTPAGS
jgi:hypothetical protein